MQESKQKVTKVVSFSLSMAENLPRVNVQILKHHIPKKIDISYSSKVK